MGPTVSFWAGRAGCKFSSFSRGEDYLVTFSPHLVCYHTVDPSSDSRLHRVSYFWIRLLDEICIRVCCANQNDMITKCVRESKVHLFKVFKRSVQVVHTSKEETIIKAHLFHLSLACSKLKWPLGRLNLRLNARTNKIRGLQLRKGLNEINGSYLWSKFGFTSVCRRRAKLWLTLVCPLPSTSYLLA